MRWGTQRPEQIHLALTATTVTDPEFYARWTSVAQFKRHIHPDLLNITFTPAAVTTASKREPGLGRVLFCYPDWNRFVGVM